MFNEQQCWWFKSVHSLLHVNICSFSEFKWHLTEFIFAFGQNVQQQLDTDHMFWSGINWFLSIITNIKTFFLGWVFSFVFTSYFFIVWLIISLMTTYENHSLSYHTLITHLQQIFYNQSINWLTAQSISHIFTANHQNIWWRLSL